MSVNDSNLQSLFTGLISTDDAENEALEFEPDRLNIMNWAVEL